VGIWLVLKVAGQWHGWKDDDRTTYSNFLIGNGLSLLFAVTGAQIIKWLEKGMYSSVILVVVIEVICLIGFWLWLVRNNRKKTKLK
jgi:hypothetical protein